MVELGGVSRAGFYRFDQEAARRADPRQPFSVRGRSMRLVKIDKLTTGPGSADRKQFKIQSVRQAEPCVGRALL